MRIILFHVHLHQIAIGAVNVRNEPLSQSKYDPETGWKTRFDGEGVNQPGSVHVVIYGRKNESTGDYELFAWHVPNNQDYHEILRYQKTISGPFQVDDDGEKLVQEVICGDPRTWRPIACADDFPRNVEARLLKLSDHIANNFESGKRAFIISNTGGF